MAGISRFVKSKLDVVITNTFTLYDTNDSGFISEEEFLSMMLNYPYKLLEATLPNSWLKPFKIGDVNFKSSIQNRNEIPPKLFSAKNGEPAAHSTIVSSQGRHMSVSGAGTGFFPLDKAKSNRQKAAPTTFNTFLPKWAVQEFRKNSTNGQMSLAQYQNWAREHHDFFKNFKEFFRTNWWLEAENTSTREKILSIMKTKASHKSSGKYGLLSKPLEECKMAIFDNLLMIFKVDNLNMPIRLAILKELDIECFDASSRMNLIHQSPHYDNFTLEFNDQKHYLDWKVLIQNFSKRSIRLKYRIIKNLGEGKFSKVFLAKSVAEPKASYAVKKINKATLREEEQQVLA